MLGKAMIDRLKRWLTDGGKELPQGRNELQLAVAALLLETALTVDGEFDTRERQIIRQLIEEHFDLTAADAAQLVEAAAREVQGSSQLFGFTSTINSRLSRERKTEVIEMLWEVAYADHVLDPLEDSLLRRVAGLIDISDRERGEAKQRVLRRLGLQPVA